MADPFEDKLAALFAAAPDLSDEAEFAARFERRLARETRVRRVWLWSAGAIGGLIAAWQGVASGLGDQIVGLGSGLAQDVTAVMGAADVGVVATPSLAAAAIALSIAALFVIGIRAAEA